MRALGGEYEYVIKRLVFGLIEQFAQQLPGPSRAPVVRVRGDAGDLSNALIAVGIQRGASKHTTISLENREMADLFFEALS